MKVQDDQDHAYENIVLLKDFDGLLTVARGVGSHHFDDEAFEQLAYQSRVEYEQIIPLLPDVGGERSLFTDLIIQSGQTIAFYRACMDKGLETRKIGELLYKIAEAQIQSVSHIKRWFTRRLFFTRFYSSRWRRAMEESQNREFPENWVGKYVEGNKRDFEYGFDFLECGFLKLAQEFGYEKVAPYVCLCDFARMRGIGIGFKRTQTLAMGHPLCDFRFSKNYETQKGWPPESLDEVRNSPLEDVLV
jgi:hypothetical protein